MSNRNPDRNPDPVHGQLPERLGFEILKVHDTGAEAVLDVDPGLMRVGETVHGAVLFSLADSVAANLALHSLAPDNTTTTDASIRFLKAVAGGKVHARARIAHAGARTRLIEVELTDEGGDRVALYQGNFLRL
jgi:1,4-dihydroxy-2-naphthoyl-CoA hydrolase